MEVVTYFSEYLHMVLGTGSHDYNLSFNFVNMTNAPVNNQDDAGLVEMPQTIT